MAGGVFDIELLDQSHSTDFDRGSDDDDEYSNVEEVVL